MDIKEWKRQFNYLMAERGEIEDFNLLNSSRPLEEIRREISAGRARERRDIMYRNTEVLSIDWYDQKGSAKAKESGQSTNSSKSRAAEIIKGVSVMEDFSNVIPITKNKTQLEPVDSGDRVKIDIQDHHYNKATGVIVEINKNKYVIELVDREPLDKKRSKGAKVRMKLNREEFKKEITSENTTTP